MYMFTAHSGTQTCYTEQVLLTITLAFVIKIFKVSPESEQHERVRENFYDWVLMITLILCLPVAFVIAVVSKYLKARKKSLTLALDTPQAAFARYKFGLASADDRRQLQKYFQEVTERVMLKKTGTRPKPPTLSDFS